MKKHRMPTSSKQGKTPMAIMPMATGPVSQGGSEGPPMPAAALAMPPPTSMPAGNMGGGQMPPPALRNGGRVGCK